MLHGVGATGFEPRVAVYLLPYPASFGSTDAHCDKVTATISVRLPAYGSWRIDQSTEPGRSGGQALHPGPAFGESCSDGLLVVAAGDARGVAEGELPIPAPIRRPEDVNAYENRSLNSRVPFSQTTLRKISGDASRFNRPRVSRATHLPASLAASGLLF